MGKSFKKTPIIGQVGVFSEKKDKRKANRCLRHKVRCGKFDLTLREVSDTWDFSKDGKHYVRYSEPIRK